MGKLEGRVALVTGAASGLGRAAALRFAAEGAAVVFTDVALDGAQAAAAEAGGASYAAPLDVTDAAQCRAVVDEAAARLGRLDVVMTGAGVAASELLTTMTPETFARSLNVNLTGTFLVAQAALPHLAKQGGSIIALGSVSGIIASPGFAAYGASKAAVIHLMHFFALEGARHGVRANTICPSWVWTPMVETAFQRLLPGAPPAKVQEYLARQSPLGRMGAVEDVVNAALFLASDDSAFMTGRELVLDGGMTLGPKPV